MTDPKRWSEGDDSSQLERELLVAGRAARLPDSERRALWASIALSLPAAPPTAPVAPSHAAVGLNGLLAKGTLFLAGVAGVTWGALQLGSARPPAEAPRPTLAVAPASSQPALDVPLPAVSSAAPDAAPDPAPPTAAVADPKARQTPASQLREESLALLEARAALRSGNAARSLALLEQSRLRFAHGTLSQEREALTIQALAQSGDLATARRRADAFLRAHPQSPYAADVRAVTRE